MVDFDLYIDSDGVICGFEEFAYQILGNRHIHEVPKGTLWSTIERHGSFFESLPLMEGAEKLVEFAHSNFKNFSILTATGHTPADAADQKRRWYAKHFPQLTTIHVVDKSPDKAAFAHQRAILVDDRRKSLDPWIAAGGIGIFHTSVDDTIEQLKLFL